MVAGIPIKITPFKRGGQLLIEAWVYNVEAYFQLNKVPRRHWVRSMVRFFHQNHFDEVREYRKFSYRDFKNKIIAMFKRPDLSHSKISELFQTQQNSDESAEQFMDRLHGLAQLGFRHLP